MLNIKITYSDMHKLMWTTLCTIHPVIMGEVMGIITVVQLPVSEIDKSYDKRKIKVIYSKLAHSSFPNIFPSSFPLFRVITVSIEKLCFQFSSQRNLEFLFTFIEKQE